MPQNWLAKNAWYRSGQNEIQLDENLPRELQEDLVKLGHETDTVYDEGLLGADDSRVVGGAQTTGRILMTLDKGIASLLHYPVKEHQGIVLFRPDARDDGKFCHLCGRAWTPY